MGAVGCSLAPTEESDAVARAFDPAAHSPERAWTHRSMSDPVPVSSKPAGEGDAAAAAKKAAAPVVMNAVSIKMAGVIRPYLDKATPIIVFIGNLLSIIEPYLVALWAYLQYVWEKLQPYHPEEMFPALAGFGAFEASSARGISSLSVRAMSLHPSVRGTHDVRHAYRDATLLRLASRPRAPRREPRLSL